MKTIKCEQEQFSITLTKVFTAPVLKVFEAWTNPEWLVQWFGPKHLSVLRAHVDLKVGGHYSIVLLSETGNEINHFGEYIEVIPSQSLIFTWVLDNQECRGSASENLSSLVTLSFEAVSSGTHLTLLHEQLPNKTAIEGHTYGWSSSFEALEQFLKQGA